MDIEQIKAKIAEKMAAVGKIRYKVESEGRTASEAERSQVETLLNEVMGLEARMENHRTSVPD